MSPPNYESQSAWKDLQQLLPKRLHFTKDHHPEEEWWENRGHTIHLDRWKNPDAKVRVILHHGVGTNGRQMSLILGVPLHEAGFDLVAIDMPGYGCTKVSKNSTYSYDDWVDIANDFINFELQNDSRPIVLYGLSAGGMLTYHTAALNKKVKGIVGMTFLDQKIPQVGDETARNLFMSRVGLSVTRVANNPLTKDISIPMWLASKMDALTNNTQALKIMLGDPSSGGSWKSMRFLGSYSAYKPAVEPEVFDVCPILLTQPAEDKWTPLHLSNLFLSRVQKVPVTIVELENAGHYPIEDPGLQQMADAIIKFLNGT
jgi:pimeloyl-ACP methyl ester carboxylesterase